MLVLPVKLSGGSVAQRKAGEGICTIPYGNLAKQVKG